MPDGQETWPLHQWLNADTKPQRLDISEPPCKHCALWHPHYVFDTHGAIESVRCCLSADIYHDFSCFREKK